MLVNYTESLKSLTTLHKHMQKPHDVLLVKLHYLFEETMQKRNADCVVSKHKIMAGV